jgi:hypothetical protein
MSCHLKILPWLDKGKEIFLPSSLDLRRAENGSSQPEGTHGIHVQTISSSLKNFKKEDIRRGLRRDWFSSKIGHGSDQLD